MTFDITGASRSMVGELVATNEQPPLMSAQAWGSRFEVKLQEAQLVAAPRITKVSPLEDPPDKPQASDISEDRPLAEELMWLGVTLPVPIELRSGDAVADSRTVVAPQVTVDSQSRSRVELPQPVEVKMAPVGELAEAPSTELRSASPDPGTGDLPTLDSEVIFLPEPNHLAIERPVSTMEEQLPTASSLVDASLKGDDPTSVQQSDEEGSQAFETPAPDLGSTFTVERSTGVASFPHNEVWSNISLEGIQSSHHPRGAPVELRTELSEVVRQVRSMVTKHETRSTIQLEPSELGRLTLELVDAPQGQRAYVSAEDPAVMRFLERNVQLLESEARLQGVGQMSFSVGADVSGGLGRGDQRRSEAEASFRKNVEWNTASNAKSRTRRELDTNA